MITAVTVGVLAAAIAAGMTGMVYGDHMNALYVSSESSLYDNRFAGAQVVEVIVNGGRYHSDVFSQPIVFVDDNPLPMTQARSGNWYGYFVEKSKAMEAQGSGLMNFGDVDTRVIGDGIVLDVFYYDEIYSTRNVLAEPGVFGPSIYAYDFAEGDDVEVWLLYDYAYGDVVTLTYDTVEDYAGLALDRSTYPQKADVHITIYDVWLNIDPTSEDVWTFATVGDIAGSASYRDDGWDAMGEPFMLQEMGLMCEDNCSLLIDPDVQGKGNAVNVRWNDDRFMVDMDAFTIRFEETGSNTGVFTNSDYNDVANVVISDDARRGATATINYNDSPIDITVENRYAVIDIMPNDENWDSGEEIPVVIIDADANRNSITYDYLSIWDPDAIIPTLVTGSPFTLNDNSTYDSGMGFMSTNTEAVSMRGMVDMYDTDTLVIRYDGQPLNALVDTMFDFKGFAYFNYHFGTLTDGRVDVTLTVADDQLFQAIHINACRNMYDHEQIAECLGDAGIPDSALAGVTDLANPYEFDMLGVANFGLLCSVMLVDNGKSQDYVNVPRMKTDALYACDHNADVALVVTFKDYVYGSMTPVVADFMSFGYSGDGVQRSERIANQIIRIEAEETDYSTGIFEGSLEYTMVNQLNILDKDTYDIDTIGNNPTFIVMDGLVGEDAPRVAYLDLGANGVETPVYDWEDIPSHSGAVSLDSSRYDMADTVIVVLEDADLNVDSELIDVYTVVDDGSSGVFGKVGGAVTYDDVAVIETFGDLGRLLDITLDDTDWPIRNINYDLMNDYDRCVDWLARSHSDWGLQTTGFTLVETGVATGIFTGDFQIPRVWCAGDGATAVTTTGLDIKVNYVDFRDASGDIVKVSDSATIN